MYKHRDPEYVNAELHDTQLIIAQVQEALHKTPDDMALHMVLAQEEREVIRLVRELEDALTYARRHTFKLAIQTDKAKYRVDKIGELLESFQGFLNKSLQVINGSKKKTIPLYLNTTYKGSFGMMISTDTDDSLMSDNEKAIAFMFESFRLMDESKQDKKPYDRLIKYFNNDAKIMKKAKRFYKSIADTNEDIRLEWGEYNRESKVVAISNIEAKQFYNYLQKKTEDTEKDIKITGVVKGVSLLQKEIEFVINKDNYIKAHFKDEMSNAITSTLDKNITALFNKTMIHNKVHDSEEERYDITKIISYY